MTQNAAYTVATLGFSEQERSALRDLLRICEHQGPKFRTHTRESKEFPQIIIVSSDQPDAVATWRAFRRANENRARFSGIMWGTTPLAEPVKYALKRPAALNEFYALLERVVTEEQGYKRPAEERASSPLFVIAREEAPRGPLETAVPPAVAANQKIPEPGFDATAEKAPALSSTELSQPVAAKAPVVMPAAMPAADSTPPAPPVSAQTEPPGIIDIPEVINPAEIDRDIAVVDEPQIVPAATPAPVQAINTPPSAPQPPLPSPGQTRILVIDDSLPVRIQMKAALQGFAKIIDFADSGEQALLLIDNCKYDLIFLDVILPGKDGYEVCRYIRRHPLQKKTPVIMLTGNAAPADRVKGKLAGCDTYLIKPVRQSVLAEIIGEFIKAPVAA